MSSGKLRVAVLASGNGSNLQAIINQNRNGELNIEIVVVLSDVADAFALQRAEQAGIATEFVNPENYPDRSKFDRQVLQVLDSYQPQLIVLAGFMRILTREFVKAYEFRIMNIHPSLLPAYKGLNTHQRVLDAGEAFHGATVHFVVSELDAGPIILQAELKVKTGETANELQQRVHACEYIIYSKAIQWFGEDRLSFGDDKVLLDGEISVEQFLNLHEIQAHKN